MGKSLILNFHNEINGALLERIILALRSRYQLISLEQLEQLLLQKKRLKNICHISFDDGERSFYQVVFPILKKYNVPASLFLSPDIVSYGKNFWFQEAKGYDNGIMKSLIVKRLGIALEGIKKFSYLEIFKSLPINDIIELIEAYQQQTQCGQKDSLNMTLDEVLEVERSGLVTIGAHTINHPVLKNENNNKCLFEIKESINRLQQLLGHQIKYFAYPNGRPGTDFDEREMKYLKDNNIAMALSTELDHLLPGVDMLSVPRMTFPRMGLSPDNFLIYFRIYLGKKWIDIKSIGKPSERKTRKRINLIIKNKTDFG